MSNWSSGSFGGHCGAFLWSWWTLIHASLCGIKVSGFCRLFWRISCSFMSLGLFWGWVVFEEWSVLISFRPFLAVYWFKFWTSCPVTFEVVAIAVHSMFVVVSLPQEQCILVAARYLWIYAVYDGSLGFCCPGSMLAALSFGRFAEFLKFRRISYISNVLVYERMLLL